MPNELERYYGQTLGLPDEIESAELEEQDTEQPTEEDEVEVVEESPVPEPPSTETEPSPTREANGDDLADMFRAPSMEDPDMQTDDLVRVSEEDVFGEGGEDMSDLLEVTEEDVMGEGWDEPESTPEPQPKRRIIRRVMRTNKRYDTPTSMRGMRY